MATRTLRLTAELLLAAEEYLKLADRPDAIIALQEIEEAGSRWSSRKSLPPIRLHPKLSRQRFIHHAVGWLWFLNRVEVPAKPATAYDQMMVEFTDFMQKERGLSPATIEHRCLTVRAFLDRLCDGERSLNTLTVADVDSVLAQKVNDEHYARVTVQTCASSLRSFFRYAEMRGWCQVGIAASIMAPRVFQHESLPSGPAWHDVQKVLHATAGDQPASIRDHAILMLLAVYGVRAGEVARLQLNDIEWQRETIVFDAFQAAWKPSVSALPDCGRSHYSLPEGGTTPIILSGTLPDIACSIPPSHEWRALPTGHPATETDGTPHQTSRPAFPTTRLCDPPDQRRIVSKRGRRPSGPPLS